MSTLTKLINSSSSHFKKKRNTQLEIPNKKSFWLRLIALLKGFILGYALGRHINIFSLENSTLESSFSRVNLRSMSVFKARYHAPMQFLKKWFFEKEYSRVTDDSIVLQTTCTDWHCLA